jgi:hypothetical protein
MLAAAKYDASKATPAPKNTALRAVIVGLFRSISS